MPAVKETGETSRNYLEWGYEIQKRNGEVLLIDRRVWTVFYPLAIFTALAILLVCVGSALLVQYLHSTRGLAEWLTPLGVGITLLFVLFPLWRTYRSRRDLPVEVADTVVIDSRAGVLRRGDGSVLSKLPSVRIFKRRDWWWTRGFMKLVILHWPGGRRVVFRTSSGRRAQEVLEMLRETLPAQE